MPNNLSFRPSEHLITFLFVHAVTLFMDDPEAQKSILGYQAVAILLVYYSSPLSALVSLKCLSCVRS